METVLEKPEVYMREIRDTLISETGTEVDISTIWKFLQTSNITRQKNAKQRSDYRAAYAQDMVAILKC